MGTGGVTVGDRRRRRGEEVGKGGGIGRWGREEMETVQEAGRLRRERTGKGLTEMPTHPSVWYERVDGCMFICSRYVNKT